MLEATVVDVGVIISAIFRGHHVVPKIDHLKTLFYPGPLLENSVTWIGNKVSLTTLEILGFNLET